MTTLEASDRHIIEFVSRYHKIQPVLDLYKTTLLKTKITELVAVIAPHNARDCYQMLDHIASNPLDQINLRDNDHLNHTHINWASTSTWRNITTKLTELEDSVKLVSQLAQTWA